MAWRLELFFCCPRRSLLASRAEVVSGLAPRGSVTLAASRCATSPIGWTQAQDMRELYQNEAGKYIEFPAGVGELGPETLDVTDVLEASRTCPLACQSSPKLQSDESRWRMRLPSICVSVYCPRQGWGLNPFPPPDVMAPTEENACGYGLRLALFDGTARCGLSPHTLRIRRALLEQEHRQHHPQTIHTSGRSRKSRPSPERTDAPWPCSSHDAAGRRRRRQPTTLSPHEHSSFPNRSLHLLSHNRRGCTCQRLFTGFSTSFRLARQCCFCVCRPSVIVAPTSLPRLCFLSCTVSILLPSLPLKRVEVIHPLSVKAAVAVSTLASHVYRVHCTFQIHPHGPARTPSATLAHSRSAH
ncbi:hypothetical protein CC78DRAFT_576367 [Lojkania enalia]|uniref:Uncharacterized protein n=1 Tax=Lojkania enalia TaxID=147567 RepID=A0A9P4KFT6_9PLEO|nr:hypothetical protein CC78DRAFT_576367 [Didymosphaeria enalia]